MANDKIIVVDDSQRKIQAAILYIDAILDDVLLKDFVRDHFATSLSVIEVLDLGDLRAPEIAKQMAEFIKEGYMPYTFDDARNGREYYSVYNYTNNFRE